ncbi:hypothetical protein COW36_05640 [bacterium (Candidatus Blackallbacteria) CG17_big_fil_post_rev_8_21_14_2_50_48_46]|uniref:Adenylate/guanylate cyclase domain-containing protein n=1 Tax=bacterium (Candidatus Blackallbacteria) CG17_big_fil_post_rev_8_21_14_2_50_48_46 TaxID=2014261 RepID=A0A2M7G837_9BACT|nr:MAG: hypothetical protein COW64_21235 [bacterium (Candidatus Blackallbacteria) CG18_big_fil_WC_8_21_14_2_50_49_26]PIW18250.1 MAG: hypothetical protein COW36_05640 [bacterium (Candidatus Blackallbacteria) CG17_big_fil_post_rev_8_21_14_2_50_48_46]PIW50681.1 MAG: hypothetical protein COW20_01905 [bacterium (Candidatus Blackallbacteria) CG13_big_fil_rev_8_21_14_2_50_49_14]
MDTDKLNPDILAKYMAQSPLDTQDWDEEATIIGGLSFDEEPLEEEGLLLEGMGFRHVLGLAPVLLGRDAGCTLSLNSKTVSRYHLAIYKFGKHYWMRDLHSTNGILHNQVKTLHAVIRAGDQLQLGDQAFQVLGAPPLQEEYAKQCIVVFLDLADSTRLSEKEGKAFTQAIQTEISKLEDRILVYRGLPLKQLGDGLMCAFGLYALPAGGLSVADQALAFAWEAVRAFRTIPDYPHLRLRVGLHMGEITLRHEEAAIDIFGDTVNLASRLEYTNKEYGTQIMISEALYHEASRTRPFLREVDTVRVAGKEEPVKIYAWDENSQAPGSDSILSAYHQALTLYRQGKFPQARACLQAPNLHKDTVAQTLARRLHTLPENAPEDWDGIWQLEKIT